MKCQPPHSCYKPPSLDLSCSCCLLSSTLQLEAGDRAGSAWVHDVGFVVSGSKQSKMGCDLW